MHLRNRLYMTIRQHRIVDLRCLPIMPRRFVFFVRKWPCYIVPDRRASLVMHFAFRDPRVVNLRRFAGMPARLVLLMRFRSRFLVPSWLSFEVGCRFLFHVWRRLVFPMECRNQEVVLGPIRNRRYVDLRGFRLVWNRVVLAVNSRQSIVVYGRLSFLMKGGLLGQMQARNNWIVNYWFAFDMPSRLILLMQGWNDQVVTIAVRDDWIVHSWCLGFVPSWLVLAVNRRHCISVYGWLTFHMKWRLPGQM